MLTVKSVKDYSSKWDGTHMIWELEFNGIPLTLSKKNVIGGDDDNIYFYWDWYVRHEDGYVMSCSQYETGYIEWWDKPLEGFDWETFRKEVNEALDIELPTK